MQDGEAVCDRCGGDAGNGDLLSCVVVSDYVEETGMVLNMHFCRANKCDKKILSKANVKSRHDKKQTISRGAS